METGRGHEEVEGGGVGKLRFAFSSTAVAGGFLTLGLTYSCQAPFYPDEAESKGAKPSEYGSVFGSGNLFGFVFSLLLGCTEGKVQPAHVFVAGVYTQAIFGGLLFGLLDKVDDIMTFLAISYVLRIALGAADAACFSGIISLFAAVYPQKVATFVGITEFCFGFGITVGPAIGSLLYVWAGFSLPFYVMGSLGVAFATLGAVALPKVSLGVASAVDPSKNGSITYVAIAKAPSIWLPIAENFLLQAGYGFTLAMLGPHMKRAAAFSPQEVGWSFLVMGLTYVVGSLLTGQACDKLRQQHLWGVRLLLVSAHLATFLAFNLWGPSPLLTLLGSEGHLSGAMVYASTALVGGASGSSMVSTIMLAREAAFRLGYEGTQAAVTGVWTAGLFLGNFAGPTAGGFLVQYLGFPLASCVLSGVYLAALLLHCLATCSSCCEEKRRKYLKV